jgi:hypothetical protein
MTGLGSPPGMGAIYIGKNTVMDSFNKTSVFSKVCTNSTDYADFDCRNDRFIKRLETFDTFTFVVIISKS